MSTPDPATTDWVPLWSLGAAVLEPHHATHEPGGSDPLTVDAVAATGSLRTLGAGAAQAAAGNDSRIVNALDKTIIDAAGDLIVGTGPDTVGRLPKGAPGTWLKTQNGGLAWAAPDAIAATLLDAKGDLVAASAADTAGRLAVGTDGQVLTADAAQALGVKWATPAAVSSELAYAQVTANVPITGTSQGAANTVVTAPAVTLDGATTIIIDFSSPACVRGTNSLALSLFDTGTARMIVAYVSAAGNVPVRSETIKLTPTAGSHTYSIRGHVDAGTGTVSAGTGIGAGDWSPAWIRVRRA